MDTDARAVYTRTIPESDVESCLRDVDHGVLSLADGDESYAVPLYHHYEDGRLLFRLGETADDRKRSYIEATDTATYVVYEAHGTAEAAVDSGWSVLVQGPIAPRTCSQQYQSAGRSPDSRPGSSVGSTTNPSPS